MESDWLLKCPADLIETYRRWGYEIVGEHDWRPTTHHLGVVMTRPLEDEREAAPEGMKVAERPLTGAPRAGALHAGDLAGLLHVAVRE
jgi:hypothetical protein